MLEIEVEGGEVYDEEKNEFHYIPSTLFTMEHSLMSIAKWEQKWEIPYIVYDNSFPKTDEQVLDYIRCMVITPKKFDPYFVYKLSDQNAKDINNYIQRKMTATWFNSNQKQSGPIDRRPLTAERIYSRMIMHRVPIEFEKWHINTLITLLRVLDEDSNPKKMSAGEYAKQRAALNKARRGRKY